MRKNQAPHSQPLEFLADVDNQRLANLCGPLDENLRQIETAFDVTIKRRGARFSVRGPQADLGIKALELFQVKSQRTLTLEDIQLALVELQRVPEQRDGPVIHELGAEEDTPLLRTTVRYQHDGQSVVCRYAGYASPGRYQGLLTNAAAHMDQTVAQHQKRLDDRVRAAALLGWLAARLAIAPKRPPKRPRRPSGGVI